MHTPTHKNLYNTQYSPTTPEPYFPTPTSFTDDRSWHNLGTITLHQQHIPQLKVNMTFNLLAVLILAAIL
jgi:hypothetical protein